MVKKWGFSVSVNNQSLSSRLMIHETKTLEITIGSHISKVVFNVISSSTNTIIIELFWLILHNLEMDWQTKNLYFEMLKEETSKFKALSMGLFGENQDCHLGALEDDPKFDQCMQNLDYDKNLKNAQIPK